jgi:hypothetical protein
MDQVRERKQKLEQELHILEDDFQRRISSLKGGMDELKEPVDYIRRHPMKSVAAAAGIGFVAGLLKKKRKGRSDEPISDGSREPRSSSGLTSYIMDELQHLAAQKAITYLSELIDRQLSGMKKETDSE